MIELLLQYNTMTEKDKLIRNMFKTNSIPELLVIKYNNLMKRMISINPNERPKAIDIIL